MPRILSVDPSAADREAVAAIVRSLGFELEEAGDGMEGLERLGAKKCDLAIINLLLPNLDGAGLVEAMRVQGDETPVLVVVTELKRATIGKLMKLGVKDVLLKPLSPVETAAKICQALGVPKEAPVVQADPGPLAGAPAEALGVAEKLPAAVETTGAKVLIIDDMEDVRRKLSALVPGPCDSCAGVNEALLLFRKHQYRLIFFDVELPVAALPALVEQFRTVQPQAVLVGLLGHSEPESELRFDEAVFDDLIGRPFEGRLVAEMVDQYADEYRSVITQPEEGLVVIAGFRGHRDRLEAYLDQIRTRLAATFRGLAEAAMDQVIVDLSRMPASQAPRVARFLAEVLQLCDSVGLELRVVATGQLVRGFAEWQETATVRCHASIEDARAWVPGADEG